MGRQMKIAIIDGYTDEPAGLGVPPYIDIYPRYIAGAIWSIEKSAEIHYITVDQLREQLLKYFKLLEKMDIVIFIAGVIVPGKYIGGKPIELDELKKWPLLLQKPIKILVGPAARFGFGIEGGKIAIRPKEFENFFDIVVRGDPELVIYNFLKMRKSLENINPYLIKKDYKLTSIFAKKGAKIVKQHPNYKKNLIVEIETYRGCPRWVSGGCSFCIEPSYGKVIFRKPKEIVEEIRELYRNGVKNFRLGRQADFFTYLAKNINIEEYPKPNPNAIEKLFSMIHYAAPRISTLHIDNVNPSTIYYHKEESIKIIKIILKYHTSGDVAAFGIESADPTVIKQNNIGIFPEQALEAIKIVNKYGSIRGPNGLPELLPGINFVLGLLGETRKTLEYNITFLKEILRNNLMIRRVNIREVLTLPSTRMWNIGAKIVEKNSKYYTSFKKWVREKFDNTMLKRIVPKLTILRDLYVEKYFENYSIARQAASYPLLVYVTEKIPLWKKIDVVVVDHKSRSIIAIPYPLNLNTASPISLKKIPGISKKQYAYILRHRPFKTFEEIKIDSNLKKYLTL